MAVINPIALATKGVVGKGGKAGWLGLATLGVLHIADAAVADPFTAAVRRTQFLTLMSGTRR